MQNYTFLSCGNDIILRKHFFVAFQIDKIITKIKIFA